MLAVGAMLAPGSRGPAARQRGGAARPRQDHGAGLEIRRAGRQAGAFRHAGDHRARLLKHPPEEPPETAAFLEIDEVRPSGAANETKRVFSGWMFASSPAISALEDPIYDVNVLDCKIRRHCRAAERPAREVSRRLDRLAQDAVIARARNLDRAETPQMFGDELRVEKPVAAVAQQRHQLRQRHLAGVGHAAEHAFAEERAAQAPRRKARRRARPGARPRRCARSRWRCSAE